MAKNSDLDGSDSEWSKVPVRLVGQLIFWAIVGTICFVVFRAMNHETEIKILKYRVEMLESFVMPKSHQNGHPN